MLSLCVKRDGDDALGRLPKPSVSVLSNLINKCVGLLCVVSWQCAEVECAMGVRSFGSFWPRKNDGCEIPSVSQRIESRAAQDLHKTTSLCTAGGCCGRLQQLCVHLHLGAA